MPDLDLTATVLNISAESGDAVSVLVSFYATSDCDSSAVDISNTTFTANFTANGTGYPATITKDAANGEVTVLWSGTQTATAGKGDWSYWVRATEAGQPRTRLKGAFNLV